MVFSSLHSLRDPDNSVADIFSQVQNLIDELDSNLKEVCLGDNEEVSLSLRDSHLWLIHSINQQFLDFKSQPELAARVFELVQLIAKSGSIPKAELVFNLETSMLSKSGLDGCLIQTEDLKNNLQFYDQALQSSWEKEGTKALDLKGYSDKIEGFNIRQLFYE